MNTKEKSINSELPLEPEIQEEGLRITVVGVGNGGLKVLNTLVKRELKGVNLIAVDADRQVLRNNNAHIKILLESKKAIENSSESNPELMKDATLKVKEKIAGYFKEADLVVVVAMLGKDTGSGGAPEILKTAKEHNILTLGLAVMPYPDEGLTDIAETAVKEIARNSDAYMLLYNENMEQLGEETTLFDAYERMNNLLADSIQALVDIVKQTGYINVGIKDIRTVLAGGGLCLISKSNTQEQQDPKTRASAAIDSTVNDPLIQVSMHGAKNVIVYAIVPKDFKRSERKTIMETIRQYTGGNPRIIFGMSPLKDDTNELHIYLIASGISEKAKEIPEVDEIMDGEITAVVPELVNTSDQIQYNQQYQNRDNAFNMSPEHYPRGKRRPTTETGKGRHVVTNLLNRKGGQSEMQTFPTGRMNFPGDKGPRY